MSYRLFPVYHYHSQQTNSGEYVWKVSTEKHLAQDRDAWRTVVNTVMNKYD